MNEFDHCILVMHADESRFRPGIFRPFLLQLKQCKNALIKFIHSNLHFKSIKKFLYYDHLSQYLRAYNRPP